MSLRILCDAIPFCYGPAAALESFLGALFSLSPEPPRVDVLATGSTLELLGRSTYPVNLLPIDSEDAEALTFVDFRSYDAFVNVCNPISFRFARACGTPTVYLDFLLWMHTGPAPDYFEADLYLAENFPGTTEWIAQRGHEIPNLELVPPLVRVAQRTPTPNSLLIGLGGLYSRLTTPGANTNYAPLVVPEVLEAIPEGRFSRVVIAGPAGIADVMRPIVALHPGAEYVSLAHEQFLRTLAETEVFVSHPGLYAPFEGMVSGVPTAFLPPSNYTQILQLRHYRALGIADHSFSWEDIGLTAIPRGLPEAQGVEVVLELLREAERSTTASSALIRVMTDFFSRTSESLRRIGEHQKEIASRFGVGGPHVAAECFLAWQASAVER